MQSVCQFRNGGGLQHGFQIVPNGFELKMNGTWFSLIALFQTQAAANINLASVYCLRLLPSQFGGA